jgi:hypothetical protein
MSRGGTCPHCTHSSHLLQKIKLIKLLLSAEILAAMSVPVQIEIDTEMQKMAMTTHAGMRLDETGIKRKIGAQIQTLHHGSLESLRRYRTRTVPRKLLFELHGRE